VLRLGPSSPSPAPCCGRHLTSPNSEGERRALAHGRAGLQGFSGRLPAFLKRGRGTRLALRASRAERERLMVIQVLLVADGPDGAATSVSTTIEINTTDPRWPAWLVDAITFQAQEGARRLRDQLIEQQAIAGDGFVPLAAVVPAAQAGR